MIRKRIFRCVLVCLAGAFLLSAEPILPVFQEYAQVEAREKKRGFFQRLFGGFRNKSNRVKRSLSDENARPTAPTKPKVIALPKTEDASRIVVIGDITAGELAKGLVKAYERTPSVAISQRITPDISITGDDYYDWLDASDFTFLGDRVKAVAVSLGTYDRKGIGKNVSFGTNRWKKDYQRRMVDIAAQLQLMGVPVIWLLPVPVIDNVNTDLAARVAEVQKSVFSPFPFILVDASGGFVNDTGRYRQSGASLTGSKVLLRLNNGIGFTKQGQRKLAYYVQKEIDIILDRERNSQVLLQAGTPLEKAQSQQVVILTRPELRQNQPLLGANGRASAFYRDANARKYFVNGDTDSPPIGRVDNFAWPGKPDSKSSERPRPSARAPSVPQKETDSL